MTRKHFLRLGLLFVFYYLFVSPAGAQSVAGLFPLEGSGRIVYNFNAGWRFLLGDADGAEATAFDDSQWPVVSAPHTVQLVPAEASGGRNYQGPCWYRKTFVVPADLKDKELVVHFEAIMGRQQVYVNGRLATEHEGGYLPVIINLTDQGVASGDSCVIAVRADNSDDKTYPPGKKQAQLDFAYHGGMYRDVWLIGRSSTHITDPLESSNAEPGRGGVFLHYDNITEKSADVFIDVEVGKSRQTHPQPLPAGRGAVAAKVEAVIKDADGRVVKKLQQTKAVTDTALYTLHTTLKNPHLWSPENPYLYTVELRVTSRDQVTSPLPHREGQGGGLDGGMVRMGIRKAEFRGQDGFWLNGKPYHQLVGANRHQDFAYVGNAVPNSQQWRDAKRLRDVGFTIIRAAHYPQDPAFMDACDELGLFVIVPTPGWQYWNKEPGWGEKVHQNTRLIIRRDRNHPSVLMWEPILNETRYPEDFALKALQITREEYPWPGRPVAAADVHSAGVAENYDVVYGWPGDDFKADRPRQCIFTREFGELVDDWYAHNNLNRASRSWGERPQLLQAMSLFSSCDELFHTTGQFIGGCQWHPFDHQRGYHPDPYWGGIYDAFRQKKTAQAMFAAVLQPQSWQPLVTIAHEMTQFSERDVTVFSNCDSVRLTMYEGEHSWTLPVPHVEGHAPSQPVVFRNVWDFFEARSHSYTQKSWQSVKMVAEGIVGGRVVCREEKMPARRSTKLRLYADDMGKPLVADGQDFIVVVCEVTDDNGNVRRLAKENVVFTVEGEGELIGDASIGANPRAVEWGSAPALIRSTQQAGSIHIHAQVQFPGVHAPTPADLCIESIPAALPQCSMEQQAAAGPTINSLRPAGPTLSDEERARLLREVEQQQADFGIQK